MIGVPLMYNNKISRCGRGIKLGLTVDSPIVMTV